MKRFLALFLAIALAFALAVPAAAAKEEAEDAAALLYHLGLFQGTGSKDDGSPEFSLDRAPTRAEAVTMLVRLLDQEDAAQDGTWTTPFTDVPDWAKPYVGYAYSKGLTNGVEANRFGASTSVTTAQYLTFLLRALGYQDGKDFLWSSPWTFTDRLKITSGNYSDKTKLLRADVALLSAAALDAPRKGSDQTLLQYLLKDDSASTSTLVIWDYDLVAFQENYASFLFFPVKASKATFSSFKIDQVTINGQSCETLQLTTPDSVAAYLASISYNAGGFGYIELSYDEDAAMAAATHTHTDAKGNTYPLLVFDFSYTAKQSNGKTTTGTFSASYFLDEDGE